MQSTYTVLRILVLTGMFIGNFLAAQVNVLLVGTVIDSATQQPVGDIFYRIYQIQPSSKLVVKGTVKSNGTFQALLRSGLPYTIHFSHHTILRRVDTLRLLPAETFEEIPDTFIVTVLKPGMVLGTARLFEPGSAQLSPQGEQWLQNVLQRLRMNRSLFLKLLLFPSTKDDQALLPERLATVRQWYKNHWNNIYARRLTIATHQSVKPNFDALLQVSEVKNLFDVEQLKGQQR